MYPIVTGVTSDVGVQSTYLVISMMVLWRVCCSSLGNSNIQNDWSANSPIDNKVTLVQIMTWHPKSDKPLLSGVPDFFDRNKILSGGDLSHYQVPHCIRGSFILFDLCLFITIFNFILNYVPIVTFWIFTYHKSWILLIIFCFIWNYLFIYFLTCLEVFWSVVS